MRLEPGLELEMDTGMFDESKSTLSVEALDAPAVVRLGDEGVLQGLIRNLEHDLPSGRLILTKHLAQPHQRQRPDLSDLLPFPNPFACFCPLPPLASSVSSSLCNPFLPPVACLYTRGTALLGFVAVNEPCPYNYPQCLHASESPRGRVLGTAY